jgi:hypothetical protein
MGVVRVLASFVVAAALAAPVLARNLPNGVTADEVAEVMRARGLTATISTDKWGDPEIESSHNGWSFFVQFYDCKTGRCESFQLSTLFTASGIGLTHVNQWNANKRFGRVFLSGSDVGMQMDMEMTRGGTTEGIDEDVKRWLYTMKYFNEFLVTGVATSTYN